MPTPDEILAGWTGMIDDDFQKTIRLTFGLPTAESDSYVYEAESFSSSLARIQEALDSKLYKYKYWQGQELQKIPSADITAYTTIFLPNTSTAKSLSSFAANAKKASARESVAHHLAATRTLPADGFQTPKQKLHANPYLDIWAWSCHEVHFVGPLDLPAYAAPTAAKQTHPMLPALYHHFGCMCPTWEALSILKTLASRPGMEGIADIGSGNGYWTLMLRRLNVTVTAVDLMSSTYRTTWIPDTVRGNGIEWLRKNGGASKRVLLLVYPVTQGGFTEGVMKAFKGDTVVIAGTQNVNRFTGFSGETVEEYFAREKKDWSLAVRIALPSFAGKDEALYVFQRKS